MSSPPFLEVIKLTVFSRTKTLAVRCNYLALQQSDQQKDFCTRLHHVPSKTANSGCNCKFLFKISTFETKNLSFWRLWCSDCIHTGASWSFGEASGCFNNNSLRPTMPYNHCHKAVSVPYRWFRTQKEMKRSRDQELKATKTKKMDIIDGWCQRENKILFFVFFCFCFLFFFVFCSFVFGEVLDVFYLMFSFRLCTFVCWCAAKFDGTLVRRSSTC